MIYTIKILNNFIDNHLIVYEIQIKYILKTTYLRVL